MATKDFSSKQEKMIADFLGWSVVAGSGAAACFPGDIISDDWLGECKTHVERGKQIFFSRSVWIKICDEAFMKRRSPVLFTDDGSQRSERTWCLFSFRNIDNSLVKTYPSDRYCNKNITFSHEVLSDIYSKCQRDCQGTGKSPVMSIDWEDEKVGIVSLDVFRELFGE